MCCVFNICIFGIEEVILSIEFSIKLFINSKKENHLHKWKKKREDKWIKVQNCWLLVGSGQLSVDAHFDTKKYRQLFSSMFNNDETLSVD